jgi:cobalamin biosynthesis Mg chelatase CobN
MNINEYKTRIKELELRIGKVQKEYDRQQIIKDQSLEKLSKLGIDDISTIDNKLTEMKTDIETNRAKLDKYLTSFEAKLRTVEELLK